MNRIATLFFFIFCLNGLFAQQQPLFTQYRAHQMFLNPASMSPDQFGASKPLYYVGLSGRYQWVKLRNPPMTAVTYFEHQLIEGDYDYNMMYGAMVIHDDTGPHSNSGIYGRYAYQLSLDKKDEHRLNIGFALGLLQNRYNPNEGIIRDPNDALALTPSNRILLDLNIGAFYYGELGRAYSGNYFYAGLSATQFPQSLQIFSSDPNSIAGKVAHYYLTSGLYWRVMDGVKGDFFIEPSMWLKYVKNTPFQSNANMRLFINSLWIGSGISLSYGDGPNIDLIHGDFGFKLDNIGDYHNLNIGFGVDWGLNDYGPSIGTSYELNVSYSWGY